MLITNHKVKAGMKVVVFSKVINTSPSPARLRLHIQRLMEKQLLEPL